MTKPLAVAICLLAGPAWAQVEVQVRTEKPQFLAGEPIFVIVEVKNVGIEQVAYDGASFKPPLELSVRNGERKVMKGLTGCGGGTGIGGGSGAAPIRPCCSLGSQPPSAISCAGIGLSLERPSFASRAGRRRCGASPMPSPGVRRGPRSNDRYRAVEGATIDRCVALTIVAASEEACAPPMPRLAAAAESFSRAGYEAVDAILEMASAFLKPEIRKLVKQRGHERGFAYRGGGSAGRDRHALEPSGADRLVRSQRRSSGPILHRPGRGAGKASGQSAVPGQPLAGPQQPR